MLVPTPGVRNLIREGKTHQIYSLIQTGGQHGMQTMDSSLATLVRENKITMAVAYGNMLGNMYQPFWSLPLLGLMGLRARDIMGFCLVLFLVCLPILGIALLF